MGIFRFFYTSLRSASSSTSAMALLRKKTGYTFANIRKALELNDNDLVKAEKWLMDQAKALGWSKLNKVQDRQAAQGLIGIAVENKKVAMVEVNCETDFVSRNDKFKSLVKLVAKTCLQQPVLTSGMNFHKVEFNSEELGKLQADNNSLADHLALLVGSVGENATLKRAFCYETSNPDVNIAVGIHPPSKDSEILLGKYGSFIAYQISSDAAVVDNVSEIANDICTHIIGMNPSKIGEFGKDEPSENANDETVLIHQDFLFNDTVTVGQVLTDSGLILLDLKRYQCGEFQKGEKDAESKNEGQINEIKA